MAFTEALVQLYATASCNDFPCRVHAAFGTLFPSICISYDEVNHQTGVLRNALDKPLPIPHEDMAERWKQWAAGHPGIVYRRSGGTRTVLQISDFLTERQFSETAFYNEFWRLLGIRHQLSAVVPIPDGIVAVSINRDAAFTAEEVRLMELMQPHFSQAYTIMKSLDHDCSPGGIMDLGKLQDQLLNLGNIEVINGSWKGNVITGEVWRS